ncbi:MAG: hypothetical protein JWR82_1774 [Blastococcus sp.]|jgi:hypothetical protein|nr:hypothetical protein [Blastococcus sp.]
MTSRSPVRCLLGAVTAVVLTACGGTSPGSDGTAAEAGAAGAPGGDRDAGGDDGTAQGNPGAPGDVAVFEEAGVPFSVLRQDAASKCADGVCRLADPRIADGDADDVGGVDECTIKEQADIVYDPPAEGGFFQEGATVTAWVDCDPGNDDDSGSDTTDGDSGTTDGSTTDDQPQG